MPKGSRLSEALYGKGACVGMTTRFAVHLTSVPEAARDALGSYPRKSLSFRHFSLSILNPSWYISSPGNSRFEEFSLSDGGKAMHESQPLLPQARLARSEKRTRAAREGATASTSSTTSSCPSVAMVAPRAERPTKARMKWYSHRGQERPRGERQPDRQPQRRGARTARAGAGTMT